LISSGRKIVFLRELAAKQVEAQTLVDAMPPSSGNIGSSSQYRGIAISSLSVFVGLFAWSVLSGPKTASIFPMPADVYSAFKQIAIRGYAGGTLLGHVFQSVKLAVSGFFVAVATAVPLGVFMAEDGRVNAAFEPILAVIRPIPPLAWVPLAIIWFGLGDLSEIFVVYFTAFVPALINTYTGAKSVDPMLLSAARVHGAGRWTLLTSVVVPSALPMIFTGLRVSLQASWMTIVAAELVGAFLGLGRVLSIAAQDIYPGMILVAMLCVAAAGAIMDRALRLVEREALPWLKVSS
jgi:NitT/TauT family transport system permease protein/taurine transport system permease protein